MIDPLKEPVLSLMLSSKNCPIEVLPLLQALPIENLNRALDFSEINHPRPHGNSHISVLELLLLRNRGQEHETVHDSVPVITQIAIELVKQGSALTNTGMWGDGEASWDIVDLAFTHGHYKFVEYLLEGPLQHLASSVANRKSSNSTWLQTAVWTQNIELAKKLLAWGADCNAVSGTGRTALYYVKTPAMLSLLLDNGARVDAVETDMYGRTLSDQWNRLSAVDVKKLNNTLLKSLKNSGNFDESSMQSSWMDNLLHSTKGVIADQQKKLKIPQDFTWEKDGVTCTPLVWMALQKNQSRTSFQQEKLVAHFSSDPQHMSFGQTDGVCLRNLDVLVFLEVMLKPSYKEDLMGWTKSKPFFERWMDENPTQSLEEHVKNLCTTLTRAAVVLQSVPWVSNEVGYTGFDWYQTVFRGRRDALEQYKLPTRSLHESIAQMYPDVLGKTISSALEDGLQHVWDLPIAEKLKECAFLNPLFDQSSLLCMYDLAQDVFERTASSLQPLDTQNIVRALANETARCQSSYYTKKNMYNPIPNSSFAPEFNVLLTDVLGCLDATPFGELFDDSEWTHLSKVYKERQKISDTDENYDKWEQIKVLMDRETLRRHLRTQSAPTASLKRKM